MSEPEVESVRTDKFQLTVLNETTGERFSSVGEKRAQLKKLAEEKIQASWPDDETTILIEERPA